MSQKFLLACPRVPSFPLRSAAQQGPVGFSPHFDPVMGIWGKTLGQHKGEGMMAVADSGLKVGA
jgi:hypothetical protein